MGANNWAICPKCKFNSSREKSHREHVAMQKYGQVSREEYERIYEEALKPVDLKETLWENYEIRTHENGEFTIYYQCGCNVCGFFFDYGYKENVVGDVNQ